jgi:hypothetical protein
VGEEAALLDAKYRAELAKGRGGFIPGAPEHEQRQHVQRQRALGYDPAIHARETDMLTGNVPAVARQALETAEPPPLAYDARTVLGLFQPPPEAKTEAQQMAWAQGVAADMSAKKISAGTAAATMQTREGLDDESRAFMIDALDKPNIEREKAWNQQEGQRLQTVRQATDEYVRENGGEGGVAGKLAREKVFDAGIAEDEAAGHAKMAEIAAESARTRAADLMARRQQEDPGGWQSTLTTIGMVLGGFGAGLTGGENQALKIIQAKAQKDAEKWAKSDVERLGIEASRYRAVEEDIKAKQALGLGAKARIASDKMLAEVKLKQIEAEKALSAAMLGTESTSSAVIPERKAGWGGGTNIDKAIAIKGQQRALEKEAVGVEGTAMEQGAKATEAAAKGRGERGVVAGQEYALPNVTSPAEGKEARAALASMSKMEKTLALIEKEAKNYGTRAWNPARFENLAAEFAYDASNAKGQGVVKADEMALKAKALGSWTGGQDVINDFRQLVQIGRMATLEQLGAIPVAKRLWLSLFRLRRQCLTRCKWPRRMARSWTFRRPVRMRRFSRVNSTSSKGRRFLSTSPAASKCDRPRMPLRFSTPLARQAGRPTRRLSGSKRKTKAIPLAVLRQTLR